MPRFYTRAALLAAILATLSIWSIADVHAQGTEDERSACMGDAFTFCSADIPNVEKITVCLKQNAPKLSPACQAEFQPDGHTRIRVRHFR